MEPERHVFLSGRLDLNPKISALHKVKCMVKGRNGLFPVTSARLRRRLRFADHVDVTVNMCSFR
jgi:hypothetical protein